MRARSMFHSFSSVVRISIPKQHSGDFNRIQATTEKSGMRARYGLLDASNVSAFLILYSYFGHFSIIIYIKY